MKPTQEQVIAWAREAGLEAYTGRFIGNGESKFLQAVTALAYEAGRKDENEACAKICDDMVLYTGFDCADAIRARREQ